MQTYDNDAGTIVVDWEPHDKQHPRQWTSRQKWTATMITSSITLMSPLASSMVAPALETIAAEFDIGSEALKTLVLSIFDLGYAFGPLFLGPLAELYGRAVVLQTSNACYLVFNLACGFSQTSTQIIVLRFSAGLSGSAPLAVGGAVISDLFSPEVRGKAISIYTSGIIVGPVLGPLFAGFVVKYTTWRWIFWASSIADAVVQLLALFLLRETSPAVLLRRRAAHLRKQAGGKRVIIAGEPHTPSLSAQVSRVLTRVVRMLLQQPIVQIQALYMAYLYGIYYLVLSTFAGLWTDPARYGYSVDIAGLQYLAIGVGYVAGNVVAIFTSDRIYRYFQHRSGNAKGSEEHQRSGGGCAEYRLPLMLPASFMVPIGLFIYGWAGQYTVFWLVPDVGIAIFGLGAVLTYQGIQAYIIESCGEYAASGLAASAFLRSLAGCTFPLFAEKMYNALGLGWGNSLLAFVSLGIGIPAVVFLWIYGARIRARKPFEG